MNQSITRFKIKLVIQGFLQVQDMDFFEIFALTIRRKLLCIYLAIYVALNLFIHQIDIVKVYLGSLLDNNKLPIFIQLPLEMYELCQIQEELLCRLLRSLYRLKQLE